MSEIGAEIVKRRKAKGWTREDLIVECGRTGDDLSYSEIVRIEQGKVQPRTRTIVQIAAALGVQPYELLPVNGSAPATAPRRVPGLVRVVELLQVLARLRTLLKSLQKDRFTGRVKIVIQKGGIRRIERDEKVKR